MLMERDLFGLAIGFILTSLTAIGLTLIWFSDFISIEKRQSMEDFLVVEAYD